MSNTVEIDRETLAALVGHLAYSLHSTLQAHPCPIPESASMTEVLFTDNRSGTQCNLTISQDRFNELLDQTGIRMWWDMWNRSTPNTSGGN